MSAMHWEARRRQRALERRTLRLKEQLLQNCSESSCNASEPKSSQEQAAGDQCSQQKTPVHHSAKIPNRYSSLQYAQQW